MSIWCITSGTPCIYTKISVFNTAVTVLNDENQSKIMIIIVETNKLYCYKHTQTQNHLARFTPDTKPSHKKECQKTSIKRNVVLMATVIIIVSV